jgi:hypothetical protein
MKTAHYYTTKSVIKIVSGLKREYLVPHDVFAWICVEALFHLKVDSKLATFKVVIHLS